MIHTSHEKIKILLLENIHPIAAEKLKEAGFEVVLESSSLDEPEIIKVINNFNILGIRSKTQLTHKLFAQAPHLLSVGAFCIGTNQIDLKAANRAGTAVFNAPYSNTRSVAELVISEMIALSRCLADRSMQAHQGQWVKSALGCREVRGKTLGIVGYGHIGSQVSILAEAMGMKVFYFDIVKKLPLGNSKAVDTFDELLKISDFLTLHVPETSQTKNMVSEKQLKIIKKGSYLINASRGTVVDIDALASALKSQHISGAAIDVFPYEPQNNSEKFETPLRGLPNVILTPHIGGSTEEAQEAIGLEVADSFIKYIKMGSTTGAVNFPNVDLPSSHRDSVRIMNVHKNVPGVLKNINEIIATEGANITSQYLATDSEIGYVVMDIEQSTIKETAQKIAQLNTSIRTRTL